MQEALCEVLNAYAREWKSKATHSSLLHLPQSQTICVDQECTVTFNGFFFMICIPIGEHCPLFQDVRPILISMSTTHQMWGILYSFMEHVERIYRRSSLSRGVAGTVPTRAFSPHV